jgi:hypothetical protein
VAFPGNSGDRQVSFGVGDGLVEQSLGVRPDELSGQEEHSVQHESHLPDWIATIPDSPR